MLQEVLGAPECMSFVFNEDGKVSSFTGGYIMDRSAAAQCQSTPYKHAESPLLTAVKRFEAMAQPAGCVLLD